VGISLCKTDYPKLVQIIVGYFVDTLEKSTRQLGSDYTFTNPKPVSGYIKLRTSFAERTLVY
jgi:hypothetical protein